MGPLLHGLHGLGEPRLGSGCLVGMDDVSGSGPIEFFGGQAEFGGAGFGIACANRFTHLAQLGAEI